MNLFVFEYVTGGGLANAPLSAALVREADMMVRALVAELLELPGIIVSGSRDPRLPPIPGIETLRPRPGEDVFDLFARGVAWADAAWPTAPETGAVLERLAAETLRQDKALLGCRPQALAVAASKRRTSAALARAGVPVVPSFGPDDTITPAPGPWVVKPDDGAGGEGIRRVPGWREAEQALRLGPARWVAQPWIPGDAGSLSLLCSDGVALLLAANRQWIALDGDRPFLRGLSVNAIPDATGTLLALGQRVVRAIPGLWGYIGVDFVLAESGPVVLEINPRLTTSYCGLRPALGVNVAAMVLDLVQGNPPVRPFSKNCRRTHEITLGDSADA